MLWLSISYNFKPGERLAWLIKIVISAAMTIGLKAGIR